MARDFVSATPDKLAKTSPVGITAVPLTMACWFNADNVTADGTLMSANSASSQSGHMLLVGGGTAGDPIRARSRTGAGQVFADTSTSYTASTWHHACGVWVSATSRFSYLNGGGAVENTTSRDQAFDTVHFGVRGDDLVPYDGQIAEAGLWNVALTAAEIASLAAGFCPLLIRPASLVSYWPLIGTFTTEIDLKGTSPLTVTTATKAVHCRIFRSLAAR